jgi:hypothetical protein
MNTTAPNVLPNGRAEAPPLAFARVEKSSEWTFEDAKGLWRPMTRAVQHVGVPGYQWQVSVLWDGSLFFGPQLWREHPAVSQEVAALGENLLDVSVGYGERMSFLDRRGLGSPQICQSLEQGRLPVPQIQTKDGDFVWNETVFAHLLGREMNAGLAPRPEDVLVVHALFHVLNTGRTPAIGRLWLHFGNSRQLRLGYKVARSARLSQAISHQFKPPFGVSAGGIRYVMPSLVKGEAVWHPVVSRPKGVGNDAQRVIEWRVPLAAGEDAELKVLFPYGVVDERIAGQIAVLDSQSLLEKTRRFWEVLCCESAGAIKTADSFLTDYAAAAAAQTAGQIGYRHQARLWMCKTTPAWYELYWPACPAYALPTLDLRGLTMYSRPVLQGFLDTQTDDAGALMRERRPKRGAVVPSEGFVKVPGFLGNFKEWTMNTLLLSHGLELWALASHFRITRDRGWLDGGTPSPLEAIVAACDWIAVQRRRTMREVHGARVPQWGLLPAASAHDWMSGYTVFNDAYCIYGMIEAVRLLREIEHPRASELSQELNDYRACLRARYAEARDRARRVPTPDGEELPYVPREVNELDWEQTDWTYTGYGPLRAGAWGAFDPHDELVDQALAFLEAGMPRGKGFYFHQSRFAPKDKYGAATADDNFRDIDDPRAARHFLWKHYVEYETAFPIGFELFLQRDDLPRFFEWLFNNMAIVVHRGFRVGVESLDGVPAETPGEAVRWRAIRAMFVNERGGFDGSQQSLWLLQAIPRSWLKPGGHLSVKRMGTYFGGHVDLEACFAQDRNSIAVSVAFELGVSPAEIRLRLRSDDGRPLHSAQVNGSWTPVLEGDTICLPNQASGKYEVIGYFDGPDRRECSKQGAALPR